MTPMSVLPLLAAAVYAAGALLVKRSADLGVGVWRTAFVANVVGALVFQPLLLLGGTWHPELWWQPVFVGLFFVIGQWFTFMSLDRGDVSVATPVLGLKVLLVAVLATLLAGDVLRWQLWAAAVLATCGIAALNRRSGNTPHHHVGRTIVMASLAAAAYAVFDVLIQLWARAWGAGRFVPLVMAVSGLLSVAFIPAFRAPLSAIPRATWPWLLAGTATLAAQSVVFVCGVAVWGHAAQANVLYSSRGLWTVVLVWAVGHWVHSREQHLERSVLVGRLVGAALMMSAIALVIF
jgi:drug/metabolite transporter (DMT)-like permease